MTFPNPPGVNNPIPNNPFYSPETPATFDLLSGVLTPNIQLVPNPDDNAGGSGWVRPVDWLPMPDVSSTEQKFVGLFAVYNLPENFIAVYFEGDYTVDWGDGTVENFNSGETAQHSYSWSATPASTLTNQGYRQVVATVIPQSGSNLTAMNLSARHDSVSENYSYSWLDISVSLPEAGLGQSIIVSQGCLFEGCYPMELQNLLVLNTGNATDLTYAVYFCAALRQAEIRNCSNVEIMDDLFEECYSLEKVSILGATSCETIDYAFIYCFNLKEVILTGTASSLMSTDYMFSDCYSLVTAPLFDTPLVQSMQNMFEWCSSLVNVPEYDTSSVESMNDMFDQCYCLVTLPQFDTSSVTDLNFGNYTQNLRYFPELDASSVSVPVQFGLPSLQAGVLNGISVDVSYNNQGGGALGRQAIVDIFNGLANASAEIDVRNNYGAADLTPTDVAIATGKGWTVLY
jgi:hypothetical protein